MDPSNQSRPSLLTRLLPGNTPIKALGVLVTVGVVIQAIAWLMQYYFEP